MECQGETEDRICWFSLSLPHQIKLGFLLPAFETEGSKIQSLVQVAAGTACAGTFSPLLYLYHEVLPYLHHGGPVGPYSGICLHSWEKSCCKVHRAVKRDFFQKKVLKDVENVLKRFMASQSQIKLQTHLI